VPVAIPTAFFILTIGSVGPGAAQHVAFETLRQAADVNTTFVPYAGNAPVVSAILGGHLASAWVNYPDVGEQIRAEKLRAFATTLRHRFEELPNVPTIAESGFKNFQSETWAGLVAPVIHRAKQQPNCRHGLPKPCRHPK
jgi:tripartite-type tricarboxylate transporter receptor subunit TctC